MKRFFEWIRVKLVRLLGGAPYPREVVISNCQVEGEIRVEEGVRAMVVGCLLKGPIEVKVGNGPQA